MLKHNAKSQTLKLDQSLQKLVEYVNDGKVVKRLCGHLVKQPAPPQNHWPRTTAY